MATDDLEGSTSVILRSPGRPWTVRELVDLIRSGRTDFRLDFPVLVPRVSGALATLLAASVYPLPQLTPSPCPPWSRIPCETARFFLGRTADNAIVLPDMTVSKRHASIVAIEASSWALVDEGSTNGTFLDGKRLRAGTPSFLTGGLAMIRLGPGVRMAFMQERALLEYLRGIAASLDLHEDADTSRAPREPHANDPTRRTWKAPSEAAPLSDGVLASARTAPSAGTRYEVCLENALVETIESWPALAAFVERHAARIAAIEAVLASGRHLRVYERAKAHRGG